MEANRVFTAKDLTQYNGLNGQPAYVAVNGLVYDLTSVFIYGDHFSHMAGADLTAEFNSQHEIDKLKDFEIVGTYVK